MQIKQVLTIAGSDSSGGAGIQADLKTFTSLHTYGASVITALTAQNTRGVEAVEATPAAFVATQLKSVLDDLDFAAIKTGMLANESIIRVVADMLANQIHPVPLIIDPVMVSTSGHVLLEMDAIASLKSLLLPLATVVTPNLPEGRILVGLSDKTKETTLQDMHDICRRIAKHGPACVLLKGGHLPSEALVDVLYNAKADAFTVFQHPRLDTTSTHGTGCTLSAAICSYMAQGHIASDAVTKAIHYVQTALATAFPVGSGSGPVNHLHPTVPRALSLPSTSQTTPFTQHLLRSCPIEWEHFVWNNAFVQGLRDATLPLASFIHFLKQDYIFLKHYARVFALAAYKSETFKDISAANELVASILNEVKLHEEYCKKFGTSVDEMEREEMGTVAYTRYVLDIANSRTLLHIQVATAPCFMGYADIGRRLLEDAQTQRGSANPYWSWIEQYGSQDFQETARQSNLAMEKAAQKANLAEPQLDELSRVFETATRLETAFFLQSMPISGK